MRFFAQPFFCRNHLTFHSQKWVKRWTPPLHSPLPLNVRIPKPQLAITEDETRPDKQQIHIKNEQ